MLDHSIEALKRMIKIEQELKAMGIQTGTPKQLIETSIERETRLLQEEEFRRIKIEEKEKAYFFRIKKESRKIM